METWRRGALEAPCRCDDVEAWRYEALEARYRCSGVGVIDA